MATPSENTGASGSDRRHAGSGGTGVGARGTILMLLYLVFVAGLLICGLIQIWPNLTAVPEREPLVAAPQPPAGPASALQESSLISPQDDAARSEEDAVGPDVGAFPKNDPDSESATPSPGEQPTIDRPSGTETGADAQENVDLANDEVAVELYGLITVSGRETLLLVAVALGGAIGSMVHALRSFYWYVGHRDFVRSWIPLYLLRPVVGVTLALVFYLVIRGGFFSSSAETGAVNPLSFTALAGLVGMFSEQAVLKLKNIAETVFVEPPRGDDAKPQKATGDGESRKFEEPSGFKPVA